MYPCLDSWGGALLSRQPEAAAYPLPTRGSPVCQRPSAKHQAQEAPLAVLRPLPPYPVRFRHPEHDHHSDPPEGHRQL